MKDYLIRSDKTLYADGNSLYFPSNAKVTIKRMANHGRIVDLDKVIDWLVNEKRCFSMARSAKLVNALSDAPILLEASE